MDSADLLSDLRRTGNYSDLTLKCGSLEFKVHKCIVCERSSWFQTACKDGNFKESFTGVIELAAVGDDKFDFSCDVPEAVELMVDFLYTGDYATKPEKDLLAKETLVAERLEACSGSQYPPFTSDSALRRRPRERQHVSDSPYSQRLTMFPRTPPPLQPCHNPDSTSRVRTSSPLLQIMSRLSGTYGVPSIHLAMHARLYGMGSKYGIPPLQSTALSKCNLGVQQGIDNEDFADAIVIAFGSTSPSDHGLRNAVIDTILKNPRTMTSDKYILQAIESVDGLGLELFKTQSQITGLCVRSGETFDTTSQGAGLPSSTNFATSAALPRGRLTSRYRH